jgi:hypothetical protein
MEGQMNKRILGFLVAALVAAWAPAQGCYSSSAYLRDLCGNPSESDYQNAGSSQNAVATVGGVTYLIWAYPNALDVFNANSPLSPVKITGGQLGLPWWPEGGGTGSGITDHIRKLAVLDGFPYAFAGLHTFGWDLLKFGPGEADNHFLSVGYQPEQVLQVTQSYRAGAMFWHAGKVYLVGQGLYAGGDSSVWVYLVYDPPAVTPEMLSQTSLQEHSIARIPLGSSMDGAYRSFPLGGAGSLTFDVFEQGGRRYLAIRNLSDSLAAAVVDLSDPVAPRTVGMWTYPGADANLFNGSWTWDGARSRLYVATGVDAVLNVFNTSTVGAPVAMGSVRWHSAAGPVNGVGIALSGDLLTVWSAGKVGYLYLGGAAPLRLPDQDGVTVETRRCSGPYYVGAVQVTPFVVGGRQYAARSLYVYGNVVSVCTTPGPQPTPAPTPTAGPGPTATPTPAASPTPRPTAAPLGTHGYCRDALGHCEEVWPDLLGQDCKPGWAKSQVPCSGTVPTPTTPPPTPPPVATPPPVSGCLCPCPCVTPIATPRPTPTVVPTVPLGGPCCYDSMTSTCWAPDPSYRLNGGCNAGRLMNPCPPCAGR